MKNYFYLLLMKTYLFLLVSLRRVKFLLCKDYLQGADMQSGELIVVGKDKVEIILGHRHPNHVAVKFISDYAHVPCNPHHHDELKYSIHNRHHHHKHDDRHDHGKHHDKYVLTIKWHVTGVRRIKWAVYF
jgi:hypothetical protein